MTNKSAKVVEKKPVKKAEVKKNPMDDYKIMASVAIWPFRSALMMLPRLLLWRHRVRQVSIYQLKDPKGNTLEMPMVDARAHLATVIGKQDCLQVVLNDAARLLAADPDNEFVIPETIQWLQKDQHDAQPLGVGYVPIKHTEIKKPDKTSYKPRRYRYVHYTPKYTCTRQRPATPLERDIHLPVVALGPVGLFRRLVLWRLHPELPEQQLRQEQERREAEQKEKVAA